MKFTIETIEENKHQITINPRFKGLELLVSLDKLFLEGDYEDKRILMGSLFTKKLFFGNEGCRTAEVNEVAEVLARFNKGFRGGEKEKAAFLGDFSATVPPRGTNPNRGLKLFKIY